MVIYINSYNQPHEYKYVYLTEGCGTWMVPEDIYTITVECYGAGAGNKFQNGGGGGAYASSVLSVLPGNLYTYCVGKGGNESDGGATNFGDVVIADGGKLSIGSYFDNTSSKNLKWGMGGRFMGYGGKGGSVEASVGDIRYAGGDGGGHDDRNRAGAGGGCAGNKGPGIRGSVGIGFGKPGPGELFPGDITSGEGGMGSTCCNATLAGYSQTFANGHLIGSGAGGGYNRSLSQKGSGPFYPKVGGDGIIKITYYK